MSIGVSSGIVTAVCAQDHDTGAAFPMAAATIVISTSLFRENC